MENAKKKLKSYEEWERLYGNLNAKGQPLMDKQTYLRHKRGERLGSVVKGIGGVGKAVVERIGTNFQQGIVGFSGSNSEQEYIALKAERGALKKNIKKLKKEISTLERITMASQRPAMGE